MSYSNFNFSFNEPNVAYADTSSDLTFGTGQFLKNGADMTLFGGDEPRFENNMFSSTNSALYPDLATISPQELSMGSIPSSANIPDMSYSPATDAMETPLFSNSTDPSPCLTDNMESTNYPSLFGDESFAYPNFTAPVVQSQEVLPSAVVRKRSLGTASVTASPMMGARPTGIRKKSKPLMPIIVDETDPVAIKRARNTEAARRSRLKKTSHVEELEAQVAELQAQLAAVQQENAQLKAQQGCNPIQPELIEDDLDRLLRSVV